MTKNILVTGIGGNVGQGILRNIRCSKYNINLIGCSVEEITPSSYLCNKTFVVPYAVNNSYLDNIKDICTVEKIDLIIPSTDHEVLELSKHIEQLPLIACNVFESAAIFFDKYKTYLHFSKNNIPFAKAFLPSEYKGDLKSIIAKPRAGRGSRGIEINPTEYSHFSDEEYMIQELHKGEEITTAFYVDLKGKLIGSISLTRTLVNGTTTFCSVNENISKQINLIISKILKCTKVTGSCNIQFINTKEGNIYPFEINGRISGTNSIRSNFGFKDVIWTIEEYLYNKTISSDLKITKGSATRILLDVIFPESELDTINYNTKHHIF